jgi:hypothetical protein
LLTGRFLEMRERDAFAPRLISGSASADVCASVARAWA